MKLRFLFFLLLIQFFSFDGVGQKRAKRTLSINDLTLSPYAIVNTQTSEAGIDLLFIDTLKTHLVRLNKKLKQIGQPISFAMPKGNYSVSEGLKSGDSTQYLFKKKNGSVRLLTINHATNEWKIEKELTPKDEVELFTTSYANSFVSFYADRDTVSLIRVYNYNGNVKNLIGQFDLSEFSIEERTLDSLWSINDLKVKLINTDSPFELYATKHQNKAYQFSDTFYLTVEDSATSTTGLISFDLKSQEYEIDYLKAKTAECDSAIVTRSSLSERYIVQVAGCESNAMVTIRDLTSKEIIHTNKVVNNDGVIDISYYDNIINTDKEALSIERIRAKTFLSQRLPNPDFSICINESEEGFTLFMGKTFDREKKKIKRDNARRNRRGNGGRKRGSGGGGGKGRKVGQKISYEMNKKLNGLGRSFYKFHSMKPSYAACYFDAENKSFDTEQTSTNIFNDILEIRNAFEVRDMKLETVFQWGNAMWYAYKDPESEMLVFRKFK